MDTRRIYLGLETGYCGCRENLGAKTWKGRLSIYRRNWAVSMQFSRPRPRSIRDTPRVPPPVSLHRKNKSFHVPFSRFYLESTRHASNDTIVLETSSGTCLVRSRLPIREKSPGCSGSVPLAFVSLIMPPRKRYLLLLGREHGHPASRSIN